MKKLIFLFALLTIHPCFTQKSPLEWSKNKKGRIVRSGTFFGVQTGKFWVGEIGVEVNALMDNNTLEVKVLFEINGLDVPTQSFTFLLEPTR